MNPKQRAPGLPRPVLRRLPLYYRRLHEAVREGTTHLRSSELAQAAGVSSAQVRKAAGPDLVSMRQDGYRKVLEGTSTLEEVWRVTQDAQTNGGSVLLDQVEA